MARTDRRPRRRLDPDARRGAILDAAADAFAERPYDEVTISAIAGQAGASNALLYRYFAGKEDLYAEIVRLAISDLLERQATELRGLPPKASVRDRVRAATEVYLDHIAGHPAAWALPLTRPGSEPTAVAAIRAEARREYVDRLRALLAASAPGAPGAADAVGAVGAAGAARAPGAAGAAATKPPYDYAVWGYFGFLDAACLHWVERGHLDADRAPLVEAALGALEGALGGGALGDRPTSRRRSTNG